MCIDKSESNVITQSIRNQVCTWMLLNGDQSGFTCTQHQPGKFEANNKLTFPNRVPNGQMVCVVADAMAIVQVRLISKGTNESTVNWLGKILDESNLGHTRFGWSTWCRFVVFTFQLVLSIEYVFICISKAAIFFCVVVILLYLI